VPEKDLYNEAKKKLAKRFYFVKSVCLGFSLMCVGLGLTGLIIHWDNYDTQTLLSISIFTIALFFLSFFLIGLLVSGTMKLKKDDIKKIIGTVVDVKRTGNADGSTWLIPVIKTTSGKTLKMSGITDENDDFEIGQKYQFLTLYGSQVIVGPAPVEERPKRITSL